MNNYGPFTILPTDENQNNFGIVIGNVKATNKTFNSIEDAQAYIDIMIPWDLIGALCYIVAKGVQKGVDDKTDKEG